MPAKVAPPPARRKIVRQRRRTVASRPAIDLVLAPKVNITEPILGPFVSDLDTAQAHPQLSALNQAQLIWPKSDRLQGTPNGQVHPRMGALLVNGMRKR